MENLEPLPRFIEPGDDLDVFQALPIFVTRQVDDAADMRRSATLATLQKAQSKALEQQNNG
jgi:hypothetical protein